MSDIQTGSLRLVSQDAIDWLEKAYPAPVIEANTSEAEIKWAAAQHAVVENLKAWAGKKQTVGPTGSQPGRPTATGAIVRMGS
ncbi:hypothetical protein CPT_Paso_034 [Rhizobium phage Paso]|uniref:Uncharacterized protein n=1 Tax=Rhizobium phage Paso TaxID=2767574 RepID=A0A7L8G5X8_9CAUD|nr:hypothetical protein CPT_Paso_034 [Rhizobium phage Paso]